LQSGGAHFQSSMPLREVLTDCFATSAAFPHVLGGKKQNLTAQRHAGFAQFAEEIKIGLQIEVVSANHRRSPQL